MSTIDALNRIDWDFPRAGTEVGSVHAAHWFPGNFIPQIPATLIEILSEAGELVVDPFCGSGTTAIEALKLGRSVVASDHLRASNLIASGKVALQNGVLDSQALSELLGRLIWRHECYTDKTGENNEGGDSELDYWFSPSTLAQLRYLWQLVECTPPQLRGIVQLLFSDTLFTCASPGIAHTSTGKRRRHHWGWVADNVRPKILVPHDAIQVFEEKLSGLELNHSVNNSATAQVIRCDARAMGLANDAVDLIVTSPPYLGMVDYTKANRLLYLWMGWNLSEDREQEIGARFKRKRLMAVEDYLAAMSGCWVEMHRVLKPGKYCAIVIGESRTFPGVVEKTMADLSRVMTCAWGPVTRSPSRRRVSDRTAAPSSERIFVFQKQ